MRFALLCATTKSATLHFHKLSFSDGSSKSTTLTSANLRFLKLNQPTLHEIIDGHLPQPKGTQADDDDEEDDNQEVAPVSTKEASNMLQSLETFWLQQDDDIAVFISSVRRMQEKVNMFRNHPMVQKSINDFFQLL